MTNPLHQMLMKELATTSFDQLAYATHVPLPPLLLLLLLRRAISAASCHMSRRSFSSACLFGGASSIKSHSPALLLGSASSIMSGSSSRFFGGASWVRSSSAKRLNKARSHDLSVPSDNLSLQGLITRGALHCAQLLKVFLCIFDGRTWRTSDHAAVLQLHHSTELVLLAVRAGNDSDAIWQLSSFVDLEWASRTTLSGQRHCWG